MNKNKPKVNLVSIGHPLRFGPAARPLVLLNILANLESIRQEALFPSCLTRAARARRLRAESPLLPAPQSEGASVVGNAQNELLRRHSQREKQADRVVDGELFVAVLVGEQGTVVACAGVPRAMVVVAHDVYEVEVWHDVDDVIGIQNGRLLLGYCRGE